MLKERLRLLIVLVAGSFMLTACPDSTGTPIGPGDGDGDTDSDTDVDSDADADGDPDADREPLGCDTMQVNFVTFTFYDATAESEYCGPATISYETDINNTRTCECIGAVTPIMACEDVNPLEGETTTLTIHVPGYQEVVTDVEVPYECWPEVHVTVNLEREETPECTPPNPGQLMTWWFDEHEGDASIDTPCLVTSVIREDATVVNLECGTGGLMTPYDLSIQLPGVDLDHLEGQEVVLAYEADLVFWTNSHLTLRSPSGGLLLAAVSAEEIAPAASTAAQWYAPVEVSVVDDICPGVADACATITREALRVTFEGATDVVLDSYSSTIGQLTSVYAVVAQAHHMTDVTCDDVPETWYEALFVVYPEG